ncbi:lipid-binding SYLF domain-containing protein [Acidobacteriota bacterium]
MKKYTIAFLLLIAIVLFGTSDSEAKLKYYKRASKAAKVLDEIMEAADSSIPQWCLDEAVGIIVIPSVKKGGLGLGGRYGRGLGCFRHPGDAWGPPVYFGIHGGSFGLQIGGQSIDVVLVVLNEGGVKSLLGDKVTLGVGAGAAAGPVGRNAEADTNLRMRAKILTYARSRGLFAGITLKGSVLQADGSANRWAYGKKYETGDIVYSRKIQPADATKIFLERVQQYAP